MCLLVRLQHPSMAIVKGAGLVMKAIIEEADRGLAMRMQEWALSEGAFPRHLHSALFAQSLDSRVLTNRSAPPSLYSYACLRLFSYTVLSSNLL